MEPRHDYENPVNALSDTTITPRQLVNQIMATEAERVDCHIERRSPDDLDRLLRSLRSAAVDGEFLVKIGGAR